MKTNHIFTRPGAFLLLMCHGKRRHPLSCCGTPAAGFPHPSIFQQTEYVCMWTLYCYCLKASNRFNHYSINPKQPVLWLHPLRPAGFIPGSDVLRLHLLARLARWLPDALNVRSDASVACFRRRLLRDFRAQPVCVHWQVTSPIHTSGTYLFRSPADVGFYSTDA